MIDSRSIVSIVTCVLSVGGYILLRFNDLRHLGKDVTEIKESQKKMEEAVIRIEQSQKVRDAVCEERHKDK